MQLDNVILTSSSTAQADAKLAGERRRQQGPTLCTPCIPRPLRVPGVAQQAVPVLRLPRVPVDRGAMLTCAPAPAHCPTARRFRAGSPDAATGRRQSSCQVGGAVGVGWWRVAPPPAGLGLQLTSMHVPLFAANQAPAPACRRCSTASAASCSPDGTTDGSAPPALQSFLPAACSPCASTTLRFWIWTMMTWHAGTALRRRAASLASPRRRSPPPPPPQPPSPPSLALERRRWSPRDAPDLMDTW